MNAFRLLDDTASRPIADWLPLLAGLIGAGWVTWLFGAVPRSHSLSWEDLFALAAKPVLAVFLASLAIVWCGYRVVPPRVAVDIRYLSMRTAAAVVSLPPLALLLSHRSTWALAASAMLAASLTRLFRDYTRVLAQGDAAGNYDELVAVGIFHAPSTQQAPRQLSYAVCASICLEAGICAQVTGHPLAGAALLGAGSAAVTLRTSVASVRQSAWRAPMTILTAMILMAVGLTRQLAVRHRFDNDISKGGKVGLIHAARALIFGLLPGGPASRSKTLPGRAQKSQHEPSFIVGASYPGVILWPETQPGTILVPPMPALGPKLFTGNRPAPLSIPFYGTYWFFQAPATSPPESSLTARGSPVVMSFRSVDGRPLIMEAHQNIGTLIDLKCCSRIQVVIGKSDRLPGPAVLELILLDTTLPGKPGQSLGKAIVTATPELGRGSTPSTIEEMLAFPVPAVSAIRQFNEVTVRFRLETRWNDGSAKIAIQRFVLVPAFVR